MAPNPILDAYRVLSQAYPAISSFRGSAKMRVLAGELHSNADLERALALIPDTATRNLVRAALLPRLSFVPTEV